MKAYKADKLGNCVFRSTARNFNPDVAKAAKVTIVEVEHIVEPGELLPDEVHLPGIYVDRIVKGEVFERRIEKRTVRQREADKEDYTYSSGAKFRIARRAAKEFHDGMYVNLGIGKLILPVVDNLFERLTF